MHARKIVAIMFSYLLNKNQQGITGIKSGIKELIMIIIMIMFNSKKKSYKTKSLQYNSYSYSVMHRIEPRLSMITNHVNEN